MLAFMYGRLGMIFSVLSCLGITLLGCAAPRPVAFEKAPLVRPSAKIGIGSVNVTGGQKYDVDVQRLFRAALEEALKDRGIQWTGDPTGDHFILNTEIIDYEMGNAFKRWLLPGWGSTILNVRGELIDGRDGSVAGNIDHQRSVHFGGLYTIGAWKTIIQSVANDIATDLQRRIEGKGFVISLASWAGRDIEIPAAEKPQTFSMGAIRDLREDRGRIGERHAAFGVSMGDIYLAPNH